MIHTTVRIEILGLINQVAGNVFSFGSRFPAEPPRASPSSSRLTALHAPRQELGWSFLTPSWYYHKPTHYSAYVIQAVGL